MNTLRTCLDACSRPGYATARGFRAIYDLCIKPTRIDEDGKRKELILNVILTTVIALVCLLELSVIYADAVGLDKAGFNALPFSVFVLFFVSLLVLSRRGHTELASYLFVGLYFLATTYGIYAWSIAVPLSILNYSAIIVIASVLISTRGGFAVALFTAGSLIALGWLETHGVISSDTSWRSSPIQFKDSIEDSFVYFAIVVVSWLSNRDIERSLVRARRSEKALAAERDSLEVKVEERTKELKTAQLEKVNQLYRFAEFGRLASGVFHDLANPLSVVSLSVERLKDSGDAIYADAREHVDKAIKASKRMETFMQTVRKQLNAADERRDFIANEEIEDAIDLLLHKSRVRGVEVGFSAAERVLLHGDPVKFFQVAVNLISNAIDSYSGMPVRERIVVSLSADTDTASFTVRDAGSGIPSNLHATIFDPFFTTKSRADGTGLGLSTTKAIVESDFSGSIELRSEPGKGSTFSVRIPLRYETGTDNRTDTTTDKTNDRERARGALASAQKAS